MNFNDELRGGAFSISCQWRVFCPENCDESCLDRPSLFHSHQLVMGIMTQLVLHNSSTIDHAHMWWSHVLYKLYNPSGSRLQTSAYHQSEMIVVIGLS